MFILVVALVGGLLAGALLGGSLANLERLSLRLAWFVVLALALQIVAFSPVGHQLPSTVDVTLHIASYVLLLSCVAANIRRPPIVCFGVGVVSNAITIFVNGGYMPASRAALRLAGFAVSAQPHNNSVLAGAGTHLAFLGDVFALPHGVPLANIFSVGDILIAVGLAWMIADGMRQPAGDSGGQVGAQTPSVEPQMPAAERQLPAAEPHTPAAEPSPLVLRCTRCGATFADRWRLRAHLLEHGGSAQWQPSIDRKPRVVPVPPELSARPHARDRRSA